MQIKKGNSATLEIIIREKKSKRVLQNLNEATAIIFMVKTNKTDSNAEAKITKNLSNGILCDNPSKGYIQVNLTPTDTNSFLGRAFMAVQLEFADQVFEIDLLVKNEADKFEADEILELIQDIIHA